MSFGSLPIEYFLRQPAQPDSDRIPDKIVKPYPVTIGRGFCPNITDKRVSRTHVVVTLVRELLKVEVKGRKPCVVNGEILHAGETGYLRLGEKLFLLSSPDEYQFTFLNNVPPPTVNNKRKKPMSNAQAKFLYQRRRDLYGCD